MLRIGRAVGTPGVQGRVLVLSDEGLGGVPGDPRGRGIDELDQPLGVEAVDAVGDVGKDPLVLREGARQLRLDDSSVGRRRLS
jgi:hypothetical protein